MSQAATESKLEQMQLIEGQLQVWHEATHIIPAQLFLPHNARHSKVPLPVLVFLHNGEDHSFEQTNTHSLPLLLKQNASFAAKFPFIGLFPCSTCTSHPDHGWVPPNLARVTRLIAQVVKHQHADRHRVSLTGHGMGGAGILRYASANPLIFSALVPISANLRPWNTLARSLCCSSSNGCCPPVWAFHAANDATVPVRFTDELVQALKTQKSSHEQTVLYSRYPLAGHVADENAYRDSELYSWLLRQRCGTCGGSLWHLNPTRRGELSPPEGLKALLLKPSPPPLL